MNQAYYTGLSGVMSHQYGMDILSDNLANVNTVGFRGVNSEFADLFSEAVVSAGKTPTANDIGVGSRLQATSTMTQNGSLLGSERFNDLALGGNGWFGVVSGGKSYYTRAGNFTFDTIQATPGDVNSSVARLTTAQGYFVTGTMLSNYTYDGGFDYGNNETGAYLINDPANDVAFSGVDQQEPLEFPTRLAYPVEPTTLAEFNGNLGGDNVTRSISADVISPANEINRLKLTFTQSAVQPATGIAWDVVATVTSNDGSIVHDTQTGQAIFDASGGLASFTVPSVNNDGATVAIDVGTGFDGLISINGAEFRGSGSADGSTGGVLTKYGIDINGIISAEFSNGHQSAIGRVAVYHFQNDQGLERAGDTLFSQSSNSGNPMFWTDADGNAVTGSAVYSGMLENSNVRLDAGLTDMIIMQRAYQANAKTITTVDEMIQKALSMRK